MFRLDILHKNILDYVFSYKSKASLFLDKLGKPKI